MVMAKSLSAYNWEIATHTIETPEKVLDEMFLINNRK